MDGRVPTPGTHRNRRTSASAGQSPLPFPDRPVCSSSLPAPLGGPAGEERPTGGLAMDWRCVAAVLVAVTVGCRTERPGLAGVEGAANGKPPIPNSLLQLRDQPATTTSRLQ